MEQGFDFYDWGSWGIGDFYDGPYQALSEALESGKPFDTGWHGWKKEIESMRVSRDESQTLVEVHAEMDDVFDLIADCLDDGEEEILTNEMIGEIRDILAMDYEFSTEATDSASLPVDASLDDVLDCAKELMKGCRDYLAECFRLCIGTVLQVMYGEEKAEEMYPDRVRLCTGEEA